jgi:uncharacterized protein
VDLVLPAAMSALGLASGLHCVGMCGGIVAAFNPHPGVSEIFLTPNRSLLLFNAGRISSYAAAGGVAGAVGSLGWYASGGQAALLVLANVVLILVGLHLAGVRGPLLFVERLGAPLWRRLQPHAAKMMRAKRSYAAGLLWGFLPCGLVYGALTAAAFAGSASAGAIAMLAYGIGTLPWLLAAGVLAARVRRGMNRKAVRLGLGGVLLGFGVWGIAHADAVRQTIFCL